MRFVVGTVNRVTPTSATVSVTVEEGGCGRCHEEGGCGSQNISRSLCQKTRVLDIPNDANLAVGQKVRVGIQERDIGVLATAVYVIPLLGLLAGAGIGQFFSEGIGSIVGAILGMGLALVVSIRGKAAKSLVTHQVEPISGEPR